MYLKLALLILIVFGTISCTQLRPQAPIYKIQEFCRKDKTDAVVVAKMQQLGLSLGKEESKFFEPKSRTDYRYLLITLNPQTGKNIQGIHVKWQKSPSLTYEEIQHILGLNLPKRGAKEIRITKDIGDTWFYVLGHENAKHPELSQVTVTCAKDNYDVCWAIDISCFGFGHD